MNETSRTIPDWNDINLITRDLAHAIDAINEPGRVMLATRAAIARAIASMRAEKSIAEEIMHLGQFLAELRFFRLIDAGIYN